MTAFTTNAGSGGASFEADTEGAANWPLTKLGWGAVGAGVRVSYTNPMPVAVLAATSVNTTGAITTAATTVGPVTMGVADGITVQVSGVHAGVNFGFFASSDGTTYWPINAVRTDTSIAETTTGVLTANQVRAWDVDMGGAAFFKVISTAWTSGSAAISILQTSDSAAPSVAAVAQGPAAAAAAIAGNPVRIGGTFTTTLPTYTTGQQTDLQVTNRGEVLVSLSSGGTAVAVKAASTAAATTDPAVVVSMAGANSATKIGDGTNNAAVKAASTAAAFTDPALTVDPRPGGALVTASAAMADAFANPTLGKQAVVNMVYNGTTWDLQRGMGLAATTGDTGAKTATGNGATQTNVGNKGVAIVVNMGAVTGTTPTAVLKVQGSLDGGTTWYDIPGATTASLTATGVYGITLYPGVPTVAGTATTIAGTATCGQPLPRTWRMVWTIGGTTPSFTITNIQYNYLPN